MLHSYSLRTDWAPGFVSEVFSWIDTLIGYATLKEMCPYPEQRCGEPLGASVGL